MSCRSPGEPRSAATTLGKNSVGTKQLKRNVVTGAKVKDGSLLAGDFKAGQLPAGERGPQGVPGAPGATNGEGEEVEGEFVYPAPANGAPVNSWTVVLRNELDPTIFLPRLRDVCQALEA
jgi:hypothetical protein